jgi:hypothetical protein
MDRSKCSVGLPNIAQIISLCPVRGTGRLLALCAEDGLLYFSASSSKENLVIGRQESLTPVFSC